MDDSSTALLGIALAAALPIFGLIGVMIRTQTKHGVKLDGQEATQKLILTKLDLVTNLGQDVAVLNIKVENLTERFERDCA